MLWFMIGRVQMLQKESERADRADRKQGKVLGPPEVFLVSLVFAGASIWAVGVEPAPGEQSDTESGACWPAAATG